MVAQSSSTVARSGVSMVSWAVWVLLVFFGLSHAHANSDSKYGDVSGEEVVIDQLEDYLRGHHNQRGQDHAPHSYRPTQAVNEKIHFAVTPKDPRYYFPISRPHAEGPSEEDFLRLLSPDLNLQNQQGFPGELQYQDEDAQYQAEYPHQYQPRFPEAVRYPAQFLSLPNIKYPGRDLFSGRQVGGPQDPSLAEATALDGGTDELTDNEREESKRMMMEEIENNAEKQSLKNFVEENVKASEKVATSQPEAVNYMHLHRTPSEAREAGYALHAEHKPRLSDIYFTALVAGCTAVAVCGIVGAGICWYRLNKSHRAAQDAEYPAYGVTGPNKDLSPSEDRKLAQSAHMYHYQHQKQQMIALEKPSGGERHGSTSDVDSEEEGEENEYTVYECPGLAPTGEMEVKNPLFDDDPTPTPSLRKETEEAKQEEGKEEEQEERKQQQEQLKEK